MCVRHGLVAKATQFPAVTEAPFAPKPVGI